MTNNIELKKNSYFASCPKGLEEFLDYELAEFGTKDRNATKGGVNFTASEGAALDSLLGSRIASRMFYHYCDITMGSEQEFFEMAKQVKWEEIFRVTQSFKIHCLFGQGPTGMGVKFKSPLYLSQLLKDSICDHFREQTGIRPDVDKYNPDLEILLHISATDHDRYVAKIYFDLAGFSLAHRGYRLKSVGAPLRENLAAAMVSLVPKDSHLPIIDPMCGSGTLLMERALMSANIPPSFMHLRKKEVSKRAVWNLEKTPFLKQFFAKKWEKKMDYFSELAKEGIQKLGSDKFHLIGLDKNNFPLKEFKSSLSHCNIKGSFDIRNMDAFNFTPDFGEGVVFINPPYGHRLGELQETEELYHQFGEKLKKDYKGCTAYILAPHGGLHKKIGLRTSRKIPVFNGNIECRILEYKLY